MSDPKKAKSPALPAGEREAATASVLTAIRLGQVIPRPKDWQQFQRNCVFLFIAELNDPNALEYGRLGQNQRGIDILGKRDANPDHLVGIQCRNVDRPMTRDEILADCEAALTIDENLKEIIFATTWKDDVGPTNAALSVEKELRQRGHNIGVSIYGWDSLSQRIALHDTVYNIFCPQAAASHAPVNEATPDNQLLAAVTAEMQKLGEQLAIATRVIATTNDTKTAPSDGEDLALHARIDTYRDLLQNDRELIIARNGLKALIGTFNPNTQPRAEFRIRTNFAAIALGLGKNAEAASLYEEAFHLRPNDPKAKANLALARLLQDRPVEAFEIAQAIVKDEPQSSYAVGYMLQAAARMDWQGDPNSLIPEDLKGKLEIDVGLSEFLRIKAGPGWQRKVIDICEKHPDDLNAKLSRAYAVLGLAADGVSYLSGGRTGLTPAEVADAATELKSNFETQLELSANGVPDLWTTASNTALMLRFAGRLAEAQDVLERALKVQPEASQLKLMLGLLQALQGKRTEAVATLQSIPENGEAAILCAELLAETDTGAALASLHKLDDDKLPQNMRPFRWQLTSELAIQNKDRASFDLAVSELEKLFPGDAVTKMLLLDWDIQQGVEKEGAVERFQEIAAAIPLDANMPTRVLIATQFLRFNRPLEASRILDGFVDLKRLSPGTLTYLRALASSRRDEALKNAFNDASDDILKNTDVLWLRAAHAWNTGDLPAALEHVENLIKIAPGDVRAIILRLEVLARQNNSDELLATLQKPIEELRLGNLTDTLRLITILNHFGFRERAAALAYRTFLGHQDEPRAWMALSATVLQVSGQKRPDSWEVAVAAADIAVDVILSNGQNASFVIEPNVELRKLDAQSWEPSHELCQVVIGKKEGDKFELVDGRTGTVGAVRHKYVSRFHYILQNYERRFPTVFGFRSISIDPEKPDGLDKIKAQLQERYQWIADECQQYATKDWPLIALATRLGSDTIDAAGSVVSLGLKLKVAIGHHQERQLAFKAVKTNRKAGCVLDLITYWTARQLGVVEDIEKVAGKIVVAQSLMDTLRLRRDTISMSETDGSKSIKWSGTGIELNEAGPEVVKKWGKDVDVAIKWLKDNAEVRPVQASDELPEPLREHLKEGEAKVFDEIILALQGDLLFVSDDLPLRQIAHGLGVTKSAWMHTVVGVAADENVISGEKYAKVSAKLIGLGHKYLGITGFTLANGLRADLANGRDKPGPVFNGLLRAIGGADAEARSHITAVAVCANIIWAKPEFFGSRQAATGLLMDSLLKGRSKDYREVFSTLFQNVPKKGGLREYLARWAIGHFLTLA